MAWRAGSESCVMGQMSIWSPITHLELGLATTRGGSSHDAGAKDLKIVRENSGVEVMAVDKCMNDSLDRCEYVDR